MKRQLCDLWARLQAMGAGGYVNGFELTLQPTRLGQPLRRRKPTVYFVNLMSDLFHEAIPDAYLDRVFDVIRRTPQHTYQILTKRAERLPVYFAQCPCPPNVWLGVSVEDRQYGLPRLDLLRQVPATIRFASVEPLLEDLAPVDFSGIHWVIVGGASGTKARPMQADWAESIKRHVKAAGAAYFFKQWGAWGADGVKRAKAKNGRILNGEVYDEYPATSPASR